MSQSIGKSKHVLVNKTTRSVPPSLPEEFVDVEGLSLFLIADRLIKDLNDQKKNAAEKIRPLVEKLVADGAADKLKIEDVKRTYPAKDENTSAHVQLKAKAVKKLNPADIHVLMREGIPLTKEIGKTTINPIYCDGDPNVTYDLVIKKLKKLVEDHPELGFPDDLFIKTPDVTVPSNDALFKALKLPKDKREPVLEILSDVAITRGDIHSQDVLIAALEEKIKSMKAEKELTQN